MSTISHGEAMSLIEQLLGELHYVQNTGQIEDSLEHSKDLLETAAQALGYKDFKEFTETD
jgi:hypothetical protein